MVAIPAANLDTGELPCDSSPLFTIFRVPCPPIFVIILQSPAKRKIAHHTWSLVGESGTRRIKEVGVFGITAFGSIFAYIWFAHNLTLLSYDDYVHVSIF